MKKKLPFILAAVAVTIFIFSNSLMDADQSTVQSDVVVDVVVDAATSIGMTIKRFMAERIVRKSAHILEFAAEGFFVTLCFGGTFKKRLQYVAPIGFITACIDECIQLFSNGRAAMVQDVFIDLAGAMAGFLLAMLLVRHIRKGVRK